MASSRSEEVDPVGSFQLAYDAARKSLAALLIVQGLRSTSGGGHLAVYDAALAQFGRGAGRATIREFAWMRRLRNRSEYPAIDDPVATDADAAAGRAAAERMIDLAEKLVPELPAF